MRAIAGDPPHELSATLDPATNRNANLAAGVQSLPMHPRKLAALVLALACAPASPTSPTTPPPAPVAATPTPTPQPEPAPRFACPPIAAPPDRAEVAERLRLFVTAVIAGDPLDAYIIEKDADSPLLAELRKRRACPTRYEDDLLTFADPALGELEIDSFDDLLNLDVLEGAWIVRRAHAALRAYLAANPDDLVSSTGSARVSLVLARRPGDATACLALADKYDAAPHTIRCWRTDRAIQRAALDYRSSDDDRPRVRLGRALFAFEPDGALRSIKGASKPSKSDIGAPDPAPHDPTTLVLHELPASSLPVAELRLIAPLELSGPPAIATEDDLCVRVDDIWRCGSLTRERDDPFGYSPPRPRLPVRSGDAIVVPVEFDHCGFGSELSECQTELHLFRVDGSTLRNDGSLPVGAVIDENVHDRDDTGMTIQGSIDEYRWHHRVEAPRCVRFLDIAATHTVYGGRYPDSGPAKNVVRRKKPLAVEFDPAPADLPQRTEYDAYHHPDLRGLWQLRGDRWRRVDRCDP